METNHSKAIQPTRFYVLCVFLTLAFACATLLSSRSVGSVAAESNRATREERLAVFDDVWSTINQRYYDRYFQGLDWQAQRTTYRDLAANAETNRELYSVLRRMIATLNDSHTRVFAPEERFDWWRPRFITIGISVSEVGGEPVVVQVEPGSAPHRAGIRVGDVIETVDAQPALKVIERRLGNSVASSTGASRMRAFSSVLDGVPASTVELTWRTRDNKAKTASFQRYWQQRELGVRTRVNGGVGVVEMDAFTRSVAEALISALKKDLRDARALVLDFRRNGGGDAEAMVDVSSAFLTSGMNMGQFTDRLGFSFTIETRTKSPFIAQTIEQTRVPVIILSSERTSSAAEIFIAALKSAGRARIIGTETCGCVLAIRQRHTLPDGGILDVSEMDYQTATADRLEKQGIKPDTTVVVERAHLYEKRDRAMEIALSELKRRGLLN